MCPGYNPFGKIHHRTGYTMTISTITVLRILAVVIIMLISLLTGTASAAMSRHDGERWSTAIRHGGKAFTATLTVLAVMYGILVVTA